MTLIVHSDITDYGIKSNIICNQHGNYVHCILTDNLLFGVSCSRVLLYKAYIYRSATASESIENNYARVACLYPIKSMVHV